MQRATSQTTCPTTPAPARATPSKPSAHALLRLPPTRRSFAKPWRTPSNRHALNTPDTLAALSCASGEGAMGAVPTPIHWTLWVPGLGPTSMFPCLCMREHSQETGARPSGLLLGASVVRSTCVRRTIGSSTAGHRRRDTVQGPSDSQRVSVPTGLNTW